MRWAHDVDVADLIEPELVRVASGVHEVAPLERGVDGPGCLIELVQDPLFDERLVSSWLSQHLTSACDAVRREGLSHRLRGGGDEVGVETRSVRVKDGPCVGEEARLWVELGHGEAGGVPELVAEL